MHHIQTYLVSYLDVLVTCTEYFDILVHISKLGRSDHAVKCIICYSTIQTDSVCVSS